MTTAIVGATLIDGNGGPPVLNSVVLVDGSTITAVGTRSSLLVPGEAAVIRAEGRFLLPGFVDTNVHLAPFYYIEELIHYYGRYDAVALESAQMLLRAGVTTVRDTYGPLGPLLGVRTAIDRGEAIGPRIYVAGNIIGWGGPKSITFDPNPYLSGTPADPRTTYLLERIQDEFVQGVGEELVDMEPDRVREHIRAYLDKGVDLLKFGGTTHVTNPVMILFSPRAQEAIVDEAHQRDRVVDVHSTSPEGLRVSVQAGVDVIQHPELHFVPYAMPDELAELISAAKVVCSMNVPHWTGRVWQEFIDRDAGSAGLEARLKRPLTGTERRKHERGRVRRLYRQNAEKLIAAACTISTASDSCALPPAGLLRGDETYLETFFHQPGTGTLNAIEGLVEVGLTPMAAIVCATKNGALASKALDRYGTVESGKSADMLLVDSDPLADISNIRALSMVMARGTVVDLDSLPTEPIYHGGRNPDA